MVTTAVGDLTYVFISNVTPTVLLPLASHFALIAAAVTVVSSHRRRQLMANRALHELRRPLQQLALLEAPGAGPKAVGPVELAASALRDLDHAINGTAVQILRSSGFGRAGSEIEASQLLAAVGTRWGSVGDRIGRRVEVSNKVESRVDADPVRLTQAVDNLVANALEHGEGDVVLECRDRPESLEIAVINGRSDSVPGSGSAIRTGDPRRGHGLKLVDEFIESLGGTFESRFDSRSFESKISIPTKERRDVQCAVVTARAE